MKCLDLLLLMCSCGISAAHLNLVIHPFGRTISLRTNENLNLICTVVDEGNVNTTFEISWILPIQLSDIRSRVNHNRTFNVLQLSVFEMQKTDSGPYICEARDGDHVQRQKISVVVNTEDKCSHQFFDCERSLCIPLQYVCDGYQDCHDGSDESFEHCVGMDNSDIPVTYKYHNLGFYQSTIYTMISCAIAFIFMSTIMLIAVCRIRMRHNAWFFQSSRQSSHPPRWGRRPTNRSEPRTSIHIAATEHLSPASTSAPAYTNQQDTSNSVENFVLLTYDNNTGFEVASYGPKPPPYAENNIGIPPPPYSSTLDIPAELNVDEEHDHCSLPPLINEQ